MNNLYRILLSGITCLVLSSSGCEKSPDDPQPTSCPTPITFRASMDGQGSIMISGVSGGTAPYTYAVANQNYQSSEVFRGPYADGSYVISVRSNGGCETSNVVSLSRILDDDLKLLTNNSSKIWRILTASGTSNPICREGVLTLNNDRGYLRYDHEEHTQFNGNNCNRMFSSGATFSFNSNTKAIILGNLRGNGTDQSFQITRLDKDNLELSGTTSAERWTLVAR